jgi:hypothetical protein
LLEELPYIILDRNTLLLKVIKRWLLKMTDVYCCWHLLKNVLNIIKHANKRAIREAWWLLIFVKNELDWNRAIRKIKEVGGQEAVDYIKALDKIKFFV